MSGYDNVIGGKLKLKGKALDVKAGGVKKKKKQKKQLDQVSEAVESEFSVLSSTSYYSLFIPSLSSLFDNSH